MSDKKLGRPTDSPKPVRITVRVDNNTLEKLDDYCDKKRVERSEGIRRAINQLSDLK